jgi:hypothetical protein
MDREKTGARHQSGELLQHVLEKLWLYMFEHIDAADQVSGFWRPIVRKSGIVRLVLEALGD